MLNRRSFIAACVAMPFVRFNRVSEILTVSGPIATSAMGKTLIHEHVLVDFIGADQISFDRWNREEVLKKVLPYLLEIKQLGVKTLLDCTPNFIGRDVRLLAMVAERSGLQIVTNTGYYGAVGNKYLPSWAFTETAEQLAKRWILEFENGIDGTNIRPGFIKIGVDGDTKLSALHQKLIEAAALTHLQTGLTICSHTGPAAPALAQLDIVRAAGVRPDAFVWVHAQGEANKNFHTKVAKMGAWVSLDGIGWGDFETYANSIDLLKANGMLPRTLVSHDAGWYKPGEADGGTFTGFTNIFKKLMPLLRKKGFTDADFDQLLVKNPAVAFGLGVKKL
jgi:phosphotriesterase-related protein